jgi:fatty acid desaturase
MLAKDLVLTDPVHRPRPQPGRFERFLLSLIHDPRDLPFLHFIIEANLVVVPFAAFLFFGPWHFWLAPIYLALAIPFYMDRFILILHNTSHRPLFKNRKLNLYLPWVLGPFFGESPETYFGHHLGMHHVEENLEGDLSSTMRFKRDSFLHWLIYFLRFFAGALIELSLYFARKGRKKLLVRTIVGELSFFAFVALAATFNWKATLVVFVIPFVFCRFIMMAGNWGQHAFIDPRDPANPFMSSITVVNCRYNRRSFNDGYHIGHHRKANRHWTEMPVEFDRDRALYAQNGAVVFHGIDFTMVWFYLMLKRYDWLARHYVDFGDVPKTREEIIALLRSRTLPIVATVGEPAIAE